MSTTTVMPDTLSRRDRPRQPRDRHSVFRWWHVGGMVVLAAGALAIRPQATFRASPAALTQVNLAGWGTHIVSASLDARGVSEPLRVQGTALWPTGLIRPDTRVRVEVEVADLLNWRHTETTYLTTPVTPRLRARHVTVDLNNPLTVAFNHPVAQIRLTSTGQGVAAGDKYRVAIGDPLQIPNVHGSVTVAARPRTWEPFGRAHQVTWSTVPWLEASARLATTNRRNFSTAPVDVTFSTGVRRPDLGRWRIAPSVPGHWSQVNGRTWQFQPAGQGWAPDTTVTIRIPGGSEGPKAADGATLAPQALSPTVQIPQGTTLRLQEWLAELGYLPVNWSSHSGPASLGSWTSVDQPPSGRFTWRYTNTPAALKGQWNPTYWTAMTQAGVIAFEYQQHLPVNGIVGPQVWATLRHAVRDHDVTTTPYAYVYVSETLPERLWLWVAGKLVLTTLANTGIPQDPTTLGTYGVDLRLPFQIMRGKNPNGASYADPVHWINYFDKSQAVHGYLRAQYGFPQSLGCVEVPIPIAQKIYPHLYIGALVTVAPPGSIPLVPPAASAPTTTPS